MELSELFQISVLEIVPYHKYFPSVVEAKLTPDCLTNIFTNKEQQDFIYKGNTYRIIKVLHESRKLRLVKNPID